MGESFNRQQIEDFVVNGYLRVDHAFPTEMADEVRNLLWKDLGLDPQDRRTWKQPVVRLGMYSQEPFVQSANTGKLHAAYDQLVGKNRWVPLKSMGTFPVRFPSDEDPGDTGWHVDASFAGKNPSDYLSWRINDLSKGRGLLMLFLYSDVGISDAPTRLRPGSHLDVTSVLHGEGEEGLSFMELAMKLDSLTHKNEVLATGKAGTVYLCHPFIVHAAQAHHGHVPKFMAQPPLLLKEDFSPDGASPVERAIRMGINQ